MPALAPPPDHVTAVVSLLTRLGWNRHEDMESTDPASRVKPVFAKVLSPRHPFPCLKCIVGPVWVTYYKFVGESTLDMDSLPTADVGTIEKVLVEMARQASVVKR